MPIKYWRILNNKNAEIITENTYKYLQPGKLSEFTKFLRFSKNQVDFRILALYRNSGGFEKYWCFSENQADLQNIGALQKIRRI